MGRPGAFVRESLGFAGSQYLSRAVLLARGLVAAATLGPHGYGGWNALNLILDYGTYAGAGAIQGLDLKLPGVVASGDRRAARRLMGGAWSAVMMGGALFSLGLVAYLAAGGTAFAALPGRALPTLMLLAALLQLAFQYLTSSLRAHGRVHAVSVAHAAQATIGGGLGLVLVLRFGVWGLIAGWLAGTAAALLWMRRAHIEAPLVPSSPRVGLSLARVGFPIFGFFAATLVLRSVDRLALVRFADPSTLGLYSIGLVAAGSVLYLPEAVAYVLFPRIAAAFHGTRDPERTRTETLQAHRALCVLLPLIVAMALVWVGPVLAALLPSYIGSIPALRILTVGALMFAAGTIPGYYLLASGRPLLLLGVGAGAALLNAALVFSVAAHDPRPQSVALAASAGYSLFAIALLALASRDWLAPREQRIGLVLASLFPAAWAGAWVLVISAIGPLASWTAGLWRCGVVGLAYLPVLVWLGRGVGLRALARVWLGRV